MEINQDVFEQIQAGNLQRIVLLVWGENYIGD
jgi:hypothetical protein